MHWYQTHSLGIPQAAWIHSIRITVSLLGRGCCGSSRAMAFCPSRPGSNPGSSCGSSNEYSHSILARCLSFLITVSQNGIRLFPTSCLFYIINLNYKIINYDRKCTKKEIRPIFFKSPPLPNQSSFPLRWAGKGWGIRVLAANLKSLSLKL